MIDKSLLKFRCQHRHSALSHPKCYAEYLRTGKIGESKDKPKVRMLFLDIETLPIVAYTWGVWEQNIRDNQIIKDWVTLSWSAKWLGDNKIMSDVLTPKEAINRNDKRLITPFWKLIDRADVIVAHNSKFDLRKINTRFWKHGLGKPSSYKIIDTLKVARSVFGLTYNKQDTIAKFIGIQSKLETDFELWVGCDKGDNQSLQYMKEYNENDVDMLEKIYLEMRDWIPNHPNMALYENLSNSCPVCLKANNYTRIGDYTTTSKKYLEYRCNECGSVWHTNKTE